MPTRPRPGTGRTKTKRRPPAAQQPGAPPEPTQVTASHFERHEIPSFSESREARIAEAAYWRAERRGFVPGQELDDWLAAEKEVDGTVGGGRPQHDRD